MIVDVPCNRVATTKRYWPGEKPDLVCNIHADEFEHIANAMGFHLPLEPIQPVAVGLRLPKCCCFVNSES